MNYYQISIDSNRKSVGLYPQVSEAEYPCSIYDLNFIGEMNLKKITNHVLLPVALLRRGAKRTDIISASPVGLTTGLLISDKIKNILEKYINNNIQFFSVKLKHKEQQFNYWIAHPYRTDIEQINFEESEIIRENLFGKEKEIITISSAEQFAELRKQKNKDIIWTYRVSKLVLKKNIIDNLFILDILYGGVKFIISDNVKKELEDAGCTGLAFPKAGDRYG